MGKILCCIFYVVLSIVHIKMFKSQSKFLETQNAVLIFSSEYPIIIKKNYSISREMTVWSIGTDTRERTWADSRGFDRLYARKGKRNYAFQRTRDCIYHAYIADDLDDSIVSRLLGEKWD